MKKKLYKMKNTACCLLGVSVCVFAGTIYAQTNSLENAADPTRPLGYAHTAGVGMVGEQVESIRLSSILISSDRKVAIINGQALRENQIIKNVGAKVKKIEADSVTLQQENKTWRVLLNKTVVRK